MTTYVLRNQNLPEDQTIQVYVAPGQTLSLVWATAGWNIAGTTDDLPTETPRGFGPFVTAYAAKTQYPASAQVLLPNGAIAKPKAAFTTGTTFDASLWTVVNDVGAAVDTGGLVGNNDARLSDARTPKPASVTPSTIQSGGLPQSVIAGLSTALQQLTDGKASHADLDAAITSLINGAPGILDTFAEVASKFNDEDSAVAAVTSLANQMMKTTDAFAAFVPMTSSATALTDAQKAQAQTNMGALGRGANLGDLASKPIARATLGLAEYNIDAYGGGPAKTQAQNDAAVIAALADMNASTSKMGVLQFPSPGAYTLSPFATALGAGQGIIAPFRDMTQLMFTSAVAGTCVAARRPNYTTGTGSKTGGLFRGVTIDMTGMPAGSVGLDAGDLGNLEGTGNTIRDNYDTNFRVDGNGKKSTGLLARNATGWSERWNLELFVSKCGTQVVFDGATTSGQSIRQSFDYGTFLLRLQVPANCDGIEFRNGPIFLGDRIEVTFNSTPATSATVAAQGLTPNADGTVTNTGTLLIIGGDNDSCVVRANSWHLSGESQAPGVGHTTIKLAAGADFQAVGIMNFASNGALWQPGTKAGKFRFLGHLNVDPVFGLMAAGQAERVVGLVGTSLGTSSASTFFSDTGNTLFRQLVSGSNTFDLGGDVFPHLVNIGGSSGTYTVKFNPSDMSPTAVTLPALNLPVSIADIQAAIAAAAAPVAGNVTVSTNISSTPAQLKFTAKGLAAGMQISITTTGDGQAFVHPGGLYNQVVETKYVLLQPTSGAAGTVTWPASWRWLTNGGQPPTLTTTPGSYDVVLVLSVNGRQLAIHLTPGLSTNGAATADVQVFTTSGTHTALAGGKVMEVVCIGASGGGGSGARGGATGTVYGGGAGSGGAGYSAVKFAALASGTTSTVTIGTPGTGGAAVTTDNTAGTAGTAGTNTVFSTQCRGNGSTGGPGGTIGGGATGSNGASGMIPGTQGGSSSATGLSGSAPGTAPMTPGGGAGGGIPTGGTAQNGGAGGTSQAVPQGSAATAGAAPGGVGANGSSARQGLPGNAGAGGASSVNSAAGAGGNGGTAGAGAGGGGASLQGFASGKGGDGAPGICIVITYF